MAERVAGAVAGTPNGDAGKPLPGDLGAMATEARLRLIAYSRLEPARELPPPEAVDRAAWAKANLFTMRGTLAPLIAKAEQQTGTGPLAGPLRAAGGMLLAGEIGGIVRLIGRYLPGALELALLAPP